MTISHPIKRIVLTLLSVVAFNALAADDSNSLLGTQLSSSGMSPIASDDYPAHGSNLVPGSETGLSAAAVDRRPIARQAPVQIARCSITPPFARLRNRLLRESLRAAPSSRQQDVRRARNVGTRSGFGRG